MGQVAAICTVLLLAACTDAPTELTAEHPLSRIQVSADGSEAWAYLAEGASPNTVVDLRCFGDGLERARAGTSMQRFGPVLRTEALPDNGVRYVLGIRDASVALVRTLELSSGETKPLPRWELQAAVDDRTRATLPPTVSRLVVQWPALRTIGIVPRNKDDLRLVLRVKKGVFDSVGLVGVAVDAATVQGVPVGESAR